MLAKCFACNAQLPEVLEALGFEKMEKHRDSQNSGKWTVEAEYYYSPTLKKVKYRKPDGSKVTPWYHLTDKKWAKGQGAERPGLYKAQGPLPDTFFLVEGEKDVDSLTVAGLAAVSLPNGAGSTWDSAFNADFAGKCVVILPDNDEPGRKYASNCAAALQGIASKVWIVDLRKVWPEIPEKGDISDLIKALGPERFFTPLFDELQKTSEWKPEDVAEPVKPLTLICAETVEYSPPKWLIEPYFQRGKGTLIQADPGTGKTAFMCAVAATVTTGATLMGIPVTTPGNVLLLSVEDDLGVLRGRFEANGGDIKKLFFMPNAAEMTLNSPEIEQAVKQVNAKLLVFDPLQAFLGAKVDMFRSNETRPVLAKLFEMCERNDCACAIIAHTSKNTLGKSLVNQSLGSVDIPAAMRSVIHITRNPEDDAECIAVHIKSSNAPKGKSISYQIVDRGGVEWHGFSDFSQEDLNAVKKRSEKGVDYENEPLVRVFNQLIADRPGGGKWTYAEVKSIGSKLLGFPPFDDSRELSTKLNSGLARELQRRDGLIVVCGERVGSRNRGIRIEQYQHPECIRPASMSKTGVR